MVGCRARRLRELLVTTVALLAMAEMIVIATGNYDLSIAYNVGLMHIVAMGLLTDAMVPWPLVVLITIAAGGVVGWINGVLVEYAKIDSFIATLGVGTILYGFGTWYTNGTQLVGNVPQAFADLNDARLFTIPLPTYMVAAVAILSWIALEHVPIGRQLYAIGGSERVAFLAGVRLNLYRVLAFAGAGLLVGIASIFELGQAGGANPLFGPELLLPAYAAAFLGVTTYRPGYFNIPGAIVAIVLLAVGFNGLNLLGAPYWLQPIFNGGVLIIAVISARAEARHIRK